MFQTSALQKVVLFLLLAFLIVSAIYYAKPFLVPLCFGGLLSMLFLPLSRWFENQKIPQGFSILLCIIIFLGLITGIIWLISWQVTDLATESTDIENKIRKMIGRSRNILEAILEFRKNNRKK
jgi:predicted PurR-regulated permease PerM